MNTAIPFNPTLHGLRGLAALMVLGFHWEQFYPALTDRLAALPFLGTTWDLGFQFSFGWLGVHLFFVLSGYLLTAQLTASATVRPAVGRFYFRRFMRIYPAVWVQLAVLLALGLVFDGLVRSYAWRDLLGNVTLWLQIPGSMIRPLNGVWWTLPIELGFYLILPGIVLIARRLGWPATVALAAIIAIGWRWYVFSGFQGKNYLAILPLLDFLPGSLHSFMAGALISQLPQVRDPRIRWIGLLMSLVALLGLQYWQLSLNDVYWRGHWILVMWVPTVATVIAAIVYFLITAEGPAKLLRNRPMVWLGDVSFGIYLWHFPVLQVMRIQDPSFGRSAAESGVALVVVMVVTLFLASLSYHVIERRAMRFRR